MVVKPREQVIYENFAHGTITYGGSVGQLLALGYSPDEAEGVVSEWAEDLEQQEED